MSISVTEASELRQAATERLNQPAIALLKAQLEQARKLQSATYGLLSLTLRDCDKVDLEYERLRCAVIEAQRQEQAERAATNDKVVDLTGESA
jgi:hypothetical protein